MLWKQLCSWQGCCACLVPPRTVHFKTPVPEPRAGPARFGFHVCCHYFLLGRLLFNGYSHCLRCILASFLEAITMLLYWPSTEVLMPASSGNPLALLVSQSLSRSCFRLSSTMSEVALATLAAHLVIALFPGGDMCAPVSSKWVLETPIVVSCSPTCQPRFGAAVFEPRELDGTSAYRLCMPPLCRQFLHLRGQGSKLMLVHSPEASGFSGGLYLILGTGSSARHQVHIGSSPFSNPYQWCATLYNKLWCMYYYSLMMPLLLLPVTVYPMLNTI